MIDAEESDKPIIDEDLAADLTNDEIIGDKIETLTSEKKRIKKGLTLEVLQNI